MIKHTGTVLTCAHPNCIRLKRIFLAAFIATIAFITSVAVWL